MYSASHYSPHSFLAPTYSTLEYMAKSAVHYEASGIYTRSPGDLFRVMISPTYEYEKKHTYTKDSIFYQLFTPQPEYHFEPDLFLKPSKSSTFVGRAQEVQAFVEEVFQLIFNEPFPDDIKVSILDSEKFHTLTPSKSVIGLSINRRQFGLLSEVFVKNDFLARVMLTIGHELGHVLTPTLNDPVMEEAKAYAFSFLWMDVIKKHNIANLNDAFVQEIPAENGLHDKGFAFVIEKMKEKSIIEVYKELINKNNISLVYP